MIAQGRARLQQAGEEAKGCHKDRPARNGLGRRRGAMTKEVETVWQAGDGGSEARRITASSYVLLLRQVRAKPRGPVGKRMDQSGE